MHAFTGKMVLIIIIISFFLGLGVVLFNKDYTRKNNIESNLKYYPSVRVEQK